MQRSLAALRFVVLISISTRPAHSQEPVLTYVALGSGGHEFAAVMELPRVQRLLLDVAAAPRSEAFLDAALEGTGVQKQNLEHLGLLRREEGHYVLSFTLLTQADIQRVRDVGDAYARSLATAFLTHRSEIEALIRNHAIPSVDPAIVAFMLVGCFSLDWDGLTLSAEKSYRATPEPRPDGRYVPWAEERGALSLNAWPDARGHPSLRRIYWGSHSTSAGDVTFTSFGDHASLPRAALPDLVWPFQSAIAGVRLSDSLAARLGPPLAQAAVSHLLSDMGRIMFAFREGPTNPARLAASASVAPDWVADLLPALVALGYVDSTADGRFAARVPVLTTQDRPMVDSVRSLGRSIMDAWFATNYAAIQQDLVTLTPQRYGVPLAEGFSQIWHYIFGSTVRSLVDAGMLADPYRPGRKYSGFIPFVWRGDLR